MKTRRSLAAVLMVILVGRAAPPASAAGRHTVDLMRLIDADKDAIGGKWSLHNGTLVSDESVGARVRIPYEPPDEYDFQIEFVRVSGNNEVAQIFRYSGQPCLWHMGGWNNKICGFSMLNGLAADNRENPTRFEAPAVLQNGRKYRSLVQVRKGSIVASINGTVVSKTSLDPSKFSVPDGWSVGADGIGVGSDKSQVQFTTIEVVEISGPGRRLAHAKGNDQHQGSVEQKKRSQPADTTFHADGDLEKTPVSGPTTRVSNPISTIKALEVYTTDSGMMLGQTSETVLTVTRGDNSVAVGFRFVTPVGDEMRLAKDEALRYIRVTYPNWYSDNAELSFEHKYTAHDGGSIGTAVGTLILSAIQGFPIDPDTAITGDISANGKVRAIGGLSAKLHGAIASKCTVVAVPMENVGQLVDSVVYNGPEIVTKTQVIGIATLEDAVAVMRSDRDPKLLQAISLFADIQQRIKNSPTYLRTPVARQQLEEVLRLAPRHLSAQMLLQVAQGTMPKTLSAGASMYYTFVAVQGMTPILTERSQLGTTQVPSATVKEGVAALNRLRPMADDSVRPLIDAWSRFIWGWSMLQSGKSTREKFLSQAQAVDDAMAKLQADQGLMQKMLKQGM